MHITAVKVLLLNHGQMLGRDAAVTVYNVTRRHSANDTLALQFSHGGFNGWQLLQPFHQVEKKVARVLKLVHEELR
jgi:hypothetical protein